MKFPHFTIPAIIPKPLLQIGSPKTRRVRSGASPSLSATIPSTDSSLRSLLPGNRDAPEWKSMCSSCSGRCARSRSKGRGRRKIDPRYAGREEWLRARACNAMAIRSKFRIFQAPNRVATSGCTVAGWRR